MGPPADPFGPQDLPTPISGSAGDRHGVALAQWASLLFLYAEDGPTQRELSRVVAIEPPTGAPSAPDPLRA